MVTREELIDQYRLKHQTGISYGAGGSWHSEVVTFFQSIGGVRGVLDYGCGKGSLVPVLQKFFPESEGWDPAVPGFTLWPGLVFDGVACLDVMEHLLPDDIIPTLETIRDTARAAVFLNISTRTARHCLPNGRNCHETVRPWEWWEDRVARVFGGWEIETDNTRGDSVIIRGKKLPAC